MKVSTFFTLLTCTGCWRPVLWSSPLKIVIYNTYTSVIILLLSPFVVFQIGSTFTVQNMDEFVDNNYILITLFVGCCKFLNVLRRRKEIISLMNVFLEEPCAPSSIVETEIQETYDSRIWRNALRYMIMIETSVGLTIFNSLLTNFPHGRLTYRAWIPYNYTSTIIFPLTFTFQLLTVALLSMVHVAVDTLFVGVLMQMCCQFEILLSRLNDIPTTDSKAILQRYVRHHSCIYQLAGTLNDTLHLTIFSQFFGSFLVLCLGLFQLLKADILSTEFFATIFYLATIMLQSFIYCWYGNEVKLKSIDLADKIFQIDWIKLNESAKKILLIVMSRARSPIELESAHVITVNIDFFVILVKSSYSVYNVLQNTRK